MNQAVSIPPFWHKLPSFFLYGLRPEMIGGTPFRADMAEMGDGSANGDRLVKNIANRMKTWFDEL